MKASYLSLLLGLSMLAIAGCSQINPADSPVSDTEKSNFELFSQFGEFHNAMLAYAAENVDAEQPAESLEDGLDYLVKLHSDFADELDLQASSKEQIKTYLQTYKNLYNKENFLFLSQTKAHDMLDMEVMPDREEAFTEAEVYSMIDASYSRGEIDSFERDAFTSLIDWSIAYTTGNMVEWVFVQNVNQLIANWEIRYANADYSELIDEEGRTREVCVNELPEGALSGVVLNISQSSMEYWEAHSTRALALIAAQDIVGAVIGGVSGAAGSAIVGGSVNWGSVAWGAAVGAVTGSTGVVGKVAKFLTTLF